MGAPGLIAAFTAGAATLAGGRALVHWGIRKGLAAPRVPHHTDPGALGLAFETLRIGTENGKSLHAWFIPGPARAAVAEAEVATAAAPAVLVMHGWGGNAALMLPLARPLHEAGYATLFVDARCHGASDDDSFASLPRFAEDTEHAFAWLYTRAGVDPARIALLGHSVGAGAVLFAASVYFVWRSFYAMRIPGNLEDAVKAVPGGDNEDLMLPAPESVAQATVTAGEI